LTESLTIPGTPYNLVYKSSQQLGSQPALRIPVQRDSYLPPSLKAIELIIQIAGQTYRERIPPGGGGAYYDFDIWNGSDVYGQPVNGSQTTAVTLRYLYDGIFVRTNGFGSQGTAAQVSNESRSEVGFQQNWVVNLLHWNRKGEGLGGWSIDVHHGLDLLGGRVVLGNGGAQTLGRSVENLATFAGTGSREPALGDGGPATQATVDLSGGYAPANTTLSHQIAVAPDGTVYFTDSARGRIRAVSPAGNITSVVNSAGQAFPADGPVNGLAYGDGGLFVSANGRVWFLKEGTQTLVAGGGGFGSAGDGGPATASALRYPRNLAYRDGNLYITDSGNWKVRKVAGGIISTVAGNGTPGNGIPGSLAVESPLEGVHGVAVAPDGTLYVCGEDYPFPIKPRLWSVGNDGVLRLVAGHANPPEPIYEDGPATEASLGGCESLAIGADGSVYIAERYFNCIRRVTPDGILKRVAGVCGESGPVGVEDFPALTSKLNNPRGIGLSPDGTLYIADTNNDRIRKVAPTMPKLTSGRWIVPSADGRQLYHFVQDGQNKNQHEKTTDARTGANVYTFLYDSAGRVREITDAHGRPTRIDYSANPITIWGPDGQVSTLKLDAQGYLEEFRNPVTSPVAEIWNFTYDAGGLMRTMKDPKANASPTGLAYVFQFRDGRLISDTDAASRTQLLDIFHIDRGWHTRHTSAATPSKVTDYQVTRVQPHQEKQLTMYPSGLTNVFEQRSDLKAVFSSPDDPSSSYTGYETRPDGSASYFRFSSDNRFGSRAPFLSDIKILTRADGSGIELTQTRSRTSEPDASGLWVSRETETTTTNGLPRTREFLRNGGGTGIHRITSTSPGGRQFSVDVNDRGLVTKIQPPTGQFPSYFSYDSAGRLTYFARGNAPASDCSNPMNTTSSLSCRRHALGYFAAGQQKGYLERFEDASLPSRKVTVFTTDNAGRPLTERYTSAAGQPTLAVTWDPNGNLATVTPPSQPVHSMLYTPVNLLDSYIPPSANLPSFDTKYGWYGDRTSANEVRPDGSTITTTPDFAGRPDIVSFAGGLVTGSVDIDYVPSGSGAGRIAALHGPYGNMHVAFSYDGFLTTGATWSGDAVGSVSWTYDNNFRRLTETVTGTTGTGTVTFAYDNDGFPTCASLTNCSPGESALRLVPDPNTGRITGITLGSVSETLGYNGYGELAVQTATFSGAPFFSVTYDGLTLPDLPRDTLGRVVQKRETIGGVTKTYDYLYDDRNRLMRVRRIAPAPINVLESYTYDANGNRDGGVYDDQDRLTSYGGSTSYTYTRNGELRTMTASGQTTTYTYDDLGNLKSVQLPSGGPLIEYLVDGKGRRVGKKKDGNVVKRWIYRGALNPVAELDGAGNLAAQFVYARRRNVPDFMIRDGKTYRIITDQLGSVRLVQNVNISADKPFQAEYSAFGEVTFTLAPNIPSDWLPFGFAGGIYDDDTKLVRFGRRDFDPKVGRWTSKEPLRFLGERNFYAYAFNDPVNGRDPTGLVVEVCSRLAVDPTLRASSIDHKWLRTSLGYEVGMGGTYEDTEIGFEHGNGALPGSTCEPVMNVDEDCVNQALHDALGKHRGPWSPFTNSCRDFVSEIIDKCTMSWDPTGGWEGAPNSGSPGGPFSGGGGFSGY
jgi:RHS repeat-associated protein